MTDGTYRVTYTPQWRTTGTVTDIVKVVGDAHYIKSDITGEFHRTMPYTGNGYHWERLEPERV